jgi:hypothetical protein
MKKQKKKINFKLSKSTLSVIGLNSINITLVILTIVLLNTISHSAQKVKAAKNENLLSQEKTYKEALSSSLTSQNQKISTIEKSLLDEEGFSSFASTLNSLKNEGTISEFSFLSETPTKDKAGLWGFPILIKSQGSQQSINAFLNKYDSLPYLKRAINVKLTVNEDSSLNLEYGGFIYVSENLISN